MYPAHGVLIVPLQTQLVHVSAVMGMLASAKLDVAVVGVFK